MNHPNTRSLILLGWTALSVALWSSPIAAQPVAVTPVFQVNTYTDGDQVWPVVAANDSGRFVVVWHSTWIYEARTPQDGDRSGLFAQIFDASGERIGTEFRVNQTTAGNQTQPAVAMDEDGGFVVVWRSETGPDLQQARILGRRFDPTGAPLGDEFAVSEPALPARDASPAVALDGEGRFIAAWMRFQPNASPENRIFARRFDATGAPLGSEFRVNGEEGGDSPSVILDAEGGFLVLYQATGLLARRFTADGEPVGDAVQLEVPARFGAQFPEAAGRPEVGSVAVWQSGLEVFGRRLDPAGNPQGLAFPVSTTSAGNSLVFQQVAVDPTGGFIVLWSKDDANSNGLGLFAQRFDASGARQGTEFRLDTGPAPAFIGAVATLNANGDFVAVWTAGRHRELDGPDGSSFAVLGRIFRMPPLGADACVAQGGHLSCDTLRDGGDSDLDLELAARPGDLPLAGNLDGDVRDDLCLYRDGLFLCDTAHDGATPEVTIAFGGAAVDVPLLGDVNGDGKDDACLRRRRRFLCDTAHNGATAEVQILFGRPADIPLLGDVDGDGDDEPCVYRAGRFSCDTAHDGRTAEVVVSFGSGGDVPLLGDVDNDGDDDFCVATADRFLCDTAHDGGAAEMEIPFAGPAGTVPVLGNLDGF